MSFFRDEFTDVAGTLLTSHTPDSGGTWTFSATHSDATGATPVISNANRCRSSGSAGSGAESVAYASPTSPTPDQQIDFTLWFETLAAEAGIVARLDTGADTFYRCRYRINSGAWQIHSIVAGTATLLGSFAETLVADTEYNARFELIGDRLKLYRDGVEQISVVDSSITAAGKVGVFFNSSGSDSIRGHISRMEAWDVKRVLPADFSMPITMQTPKWTVKRPVADFVGFVPVFGDIVIHGGVRVVQPEIFIGFQFVIAPHFHNLKVKPTVAPVPGIVFVMGTPVLVNISFEQKVIEFVQVLSER